MLAFLGQAGRHLVTVQVIQRANRIVEDDGRLRINRGQFGEEGSKCDATMLAFAQDPIGEDGTEPFVVNGSTWRILSKIE